MDRFQEIRIAIVYWCFLVWGAFVISAASMLLCTSGSQQQGAGAILGIFAGPPAVIALVIGTFLALTVWHVRRIQILLLATVLLFGAIALEAVNLTRLTDTIETIVAAGYGLLLIGVSVHSLTRFGMLAVFSIVVAIVGFLVLGGATGNLFFLIVGVMIVPAVTLIRYRNDHPKT